jgi:hypothetical protein
MFHVINQQLARLWRQILEIELARDNATAAAHGWQVRQVKPGTWSYRDPRFGQHPVGKVASTVQAALYDGHEVTVVDGKSTWRR